jgi:hypothetical protein
MEPSANEEPTRTARHKAVSPKEPLVVPAPEVKVVMPQQAAVPAWVYGFLGVVIGLQFLGLLVVTYAVSGRRQQAFPGVTLQQDGSSCTFRFVP